MAFKDTTERNAMNYYISDLHIGHENILRFDNRPFADVNEMNNKLIENWNARVRSDDTVYILGDFIWAKESEWPSIVGLLGGNKVLIRGNHDPKQFSAATKRMFQEITNLKEIKDSGKHVVMCHYPIPFFRASFASTAFMLYGHVHQTIEYCCKNNGPNVDSTPFIAQAKQKSTKDMTFMAGSNLRSTIEFTGALRLRYSLAYATLSDFDSEIKKANNPSTAGNKLYVVATIGRDSSESGALKKKIENFFESNRETNAVVVDSSSVLLGESEYTEFVENYAMALAIANSDIDQRKTYEGYSDKYQAIGSHRVDRIAACPCILDESAVPQPVGFDVSKYIKTTFRMYNAPRAEVELLCDNSVMDAIIDRFGPDVQTYAGDLQNFRVIEEIAVGKVFFNWIFGFEGKVRIKGPESVKKQYREMVMSAMNLV